MIDKNLPFNIIKNKKFFFTGKELNKLSDNFLKKELKQSLLKK